MIEWQASLLDSPGPAFYIQERVGWGMRPFRLIKFRSMASRRLSADRQFEEDPGAEQRRRVPL